jgi:hypothetical protein
LVGSRRCREARRRSNGGVGSRWAGNRGGGGGVEFPAEPEVGDEVRDLFVISEKFKGWIEI